MKIKSIAALMLTLPVPATGVLFGMILFPGTITGRVVFACAKIWILVSPLIWYFLIEKKNPGKIKFSGSGIPAGIISGLIIFIIILTAYLSFGKNMIDPENLKKIALTTGLSDTKQYIILACYWTFVNSLLEEYFWRWFIVRVTNNISNSVTAVMLSAVGFSIHHIVAMQMYFTWNIIILCTIGLIIGGVLWSWLFIRFKSIIPGYISHAIVDASVFLVGYMMIFG